MTGWARLRGRRLRLWLRGCCGCGFPLLARWLARWTVPASGCPWPQILSTASRLARDSEGVEVPAASNRWAESCGRGVGGAVARRLRILRGWGGEMGGPELGAWPQARKSAEHFGFHGPTTREPGGRWGRGLGWAARIGRAVPEPRPSGAGGKGSRSRSLTPPPSAAQLLLVGCQVTSCGGPPRALSPAAAAGTHRPLPFPGRRPPRLLLLGAAAFSWKTFAKVFMSLRTFFSF